VEASFENQSGCDATSHTEAQTVKFIKCPILDSKSIWENDQSRSKLQFYSGVYSNLLLNFFRLAKI
jgi:hypothetical protein